MKGTSYEIFHQTADTSSQEAVINTKETTSEKTSPEVHTHPAFTCERTPVMNTQLMQKLSERNACLISMGLKTVGSKDAFSYIEEELFINEAESVRLFIEWIDKNHHKASPDFRFVEENFPNLYENYFLKESQTPEPVIINVAKKTYAVFLFDGKKEGWDAYTFLKNIELNENAFTLGEGAEGVITGKNIFIEQFRNSPDGFKTFGGQVKIHSVLFADMFCFYKRGNGLKEIVLAERINNQPTTKERN